MSFGIVLRQSTLALVMLTKRCSNAGGPLHTTILFEKLWYIYIISRDCLFTVLFVWNFGHF